jgi:bifunctional non-homologous end joining protein LigD
VFDILYLDGRATLNLPYAERRTLLEELALDGPAWRTPASLVVERSDDFVARVAELGLEGVVAKRRDNTRQEGAASATTAKEAEGARQEALDPGVNARDHRGNG